MKKLILSSFILTTTIFAQDVQTILTNNGCMGCHAIASRKAAPAFAGIAKRNLRFNGDNAANVIKNSIKNGSSGKYPRFNDTAMPAFSNLSEDELDEISTFILMQASKATGHGGGMGMHGGKGGRGMMNF